MLADFLGFNQLDDIAQALQTFSIEPFAMSSLRREVMQAIHCLLRVASDVAIAANSQSQFVRQAALLRANALLEELDTEVTTLRCPEQILIQGIIHRWSHLVTEAGKQAGQLTRSLPLITNPYITGTPVTGKLFVGREDILNRLIEELSLGSGACPSIVLYGHRRMGKSSILKNLPNT